MSDHTAENDAPSGPAESATVDRPGGVPRSAAWFELFYDLVIVATVAATGKVLSESPDWPTTALIVTALLVLFIIWLLTTLTYSLQPNKDRVRQMLSLMQMVLLALSALSLGSAGLPNWVGFLAGGGALLTVAAIYWRTARLTAFTRLTQLITRITVLAGLAFLASAVASVWLTSAQATIIAPVLILIGAGIVLIPFSTVITRMLATGGTINAHHVSERVEVLVVIVLGESLLAQISALTGLGRIPNPVFFILAFAVAYAIWTLYEAMVTSSGLPVGAVGLRQWFIGHAVLIIALVLLAVAISDLAATDPGDLPGGSVWSPLPVLLTVLALAWLALITRPAQRAVWVFYGGAVALIAVVALVSAALADQVPAIGSWGVLAGAVLIIGMAITVRLLPATRSPT